jgi:hypothetical protein
MSRAIWDMVACRNEGPSMVFVQHGCRPACSQLSKAQCAAKNTGCVRGEGTHISKGGDRCKQCWRGGMQGGWCVACWMLLAVGHACALLPEISGVCCPHVTQHTRLCIVLLCLVYSQHGVVKQSVHVCVYVWRHTRFYKGVFVECAVLCKVSGSSLGCRVVCSAMPTGRLTQIYLTCLTGCAR